MGAMELDGQANILRQMLEQARKAEKRRMKLQSKSMEILNSASNSARLAKQEKASRKHRKRAEKILTRLPVGSIASEIFRLRFMEGMSWECVQGKTGTTESECKAEYWRGLQMLLDDCEVRRLVEQYAADSSSRRKL